MKFLSALTVAGAMFMTSCSSDDDKGGNGGDAGNMTWEEAIAASNAQNALPLVNATIVLPEGTYNLNGKLELGEGSILNIAAGTRIVAAGGTNSYIAIGQGAKINADGTSTKPIVFTSNDTTPGSWGGIVICGKAPANIGTAQAEVSNLRYGGDNPSDNSGVVRYVRIEHAGAAYNAEKEFNGLSLFAVGNGTTVEYVQLYRGADDGIEWFGGTVNTKYIVSNGNGDDQFDWTEGWNGTNENWYGRVELVDGHLEGRKGNRGIEADNSANNHALTPTSSPTIKNMTLVGLGASNTGSENQAMKLRVGTQGKFENVVLAEWKRGIDIQHDVTLSWIPSQLFIDKVQFVNVEEKSKGTDNNSATVDVSAAYLEGNNSGAGNGAGVPTWTQGWTVGL